ncbi:peptidylprolyl isomerase [Laspinema olomoucense]|uniref:peptidylprolyl isomerase n=1 Tax=Laspinema olomoucense TaxID=3231600 RepID=UPI0021BA9A1C|nr:peptidylprolyl isomerase [Laspinema sp. D3d]MCT7972485.1 peptidylprolyl isomerase [Laspinema sp. D3d]
MNNLAKTRLDLVEIVNSLKKEIRLREVYQKILFQQIIERTSKDRGITVTPEEIQIEAEQFRAKNRLEKAADTLAWLEDCMISADDWEAGIRDRLLAQKLAQALFSKEVEKYFAENKINFEKILLYQIIVPYQKVAFELFYQIEEREISFYHAAHLYDIDARRRMVCGYEGTITRSQLIPDLAANIFRTPVGELGGPVKTEAGYHLFLVEELICAELTPEVREEIQNQIFNQWLTSELTYLLHNSP